MEAVGQLAGGIAHDFNNLLTAINGYSDVVLARLGDGDERVRHGVEQIRRAGEQAAELTSQLLAFSRQQQQRDEPFDLNAVTAGYVTMLERLVGPDVEVELRLDPDLPPVHGDAGRLGQVILNLVVNARDAMPDGGRLSIETSALATSAGRFAVLSVSDTGCGMDAATRERIFDPFFTTKGPGIGTGLGLSTVHGIVEQSGGTIVCRSEPGLGTTFTIRLPAAEGAPAPQAAVDEERSRAAGGSCSSRTRSWSGGSSTRCSSTPATRSTTRPRRPRRSPSPPIATSTCC
jgi:signal transduction histidine kinase